MVITVGKFLSVGYGFFGRVGSDTRRVLLTADAACAIEIVP